jgi:hypothetical protein
MQTFQSGRAGGSAAPNAQQRPSRRTCCQNASSTASLSPGTAVGSPAPCEPQHAQLSQPPQTTERTCKRATKRARTAPEQLLHDTVSRSLSAAGCAQQRAAARAACTPPQELPAPRRNAAAASRCCRRPEAGGKTRRQRTPAQRAWTQRRGARGARLWARLRVARARGALAAWRWPLRNSCAACAQRGCVRLPQRPPRARAGTRARV